MGKSLYNIKYGADKNIITNKDIITKNATDKITKKENERREDLIIKAVEKVDEKRAQILEIEKEIAKIEELSEKALDDGTKEAYKELEEEIGCYKWKGSSGSGFMQYVGY